MAAPYVSFGVCRVCPKEENSMGMKGLELHEEGTSMCVCVCVCVRSLHFKLPLELEEKLNSQMNTLASFLLTMTYIYTKKLNLGLLALIPTL